MSGNEGEEGRESKRVMIQAGGRQGRIGGMRVKDWEVRVSREGEGLGRCAGNESCGVVEGTVVWI